MARNKTLKARLRRKRHIRKKLNGTTERPRLSVFRSARHIYVQVIDDTVGTTLAAASSLDKEVRAAPEKGKKRDVARHVGELLAKRCLDKEIKKVSFDRNGFIYHGRLAAVAEGARSGGLEF